MIFQRGQFSERPNRLQQAAFQLFWLVIFFLPWQAVLIYQTGWLGGAKWQYGTIAFYFLEPVFWLAVILTLLGRHRSGVPGFWAGRPGLSWGLVGLAGWSALGVLTGGCDFLSWYWWYRLTAGLIFLVAVVDLPFSRKKFFPALAAAGGLQGILAVWQFGFQKVLPAKLLGIAGQLPELLGTAVVAAADQRWLRAYGGFNHPNILGGFLVIAFLAGLFCYLGRPAGWPKVFLAAGLTATAAGFFLSFSRSAWLGLAAALAVCFFGLVAGFRFEKKRLKDFFRICLYLAAVIGLLTAVFWPLTAARIFSSGRLEEQSVSRRLDYLEESREIITNSGPAGTGVGGYTRWLYRFWPGWAAWDYQPVHNLYLLMAAELGLVGFFVWLFWAGRVFWIGRKNGLFGLALLGGFLVIGFFDHYFWTNYHGIMIWWLAWAFHLKEF